MPRLVYSWACVHIAIESAGRASGLNPEHIIAPEFLWINWILAVLWLSFGIQIWFVRTA